MWENIKSRGTELSLNTRRIWSLIALFAAADTVGLKAEGMTFSPHAFLSDITTIAILLALSLVCTYVRPNDRTGEMLHIGAAFLIFTAIAVVSSYLIAAGYRQQPLVDAYLVATDHALGLDWLASYKWVVAHPLVHKALWFGYSSVTMQIILLLLIMNFRGQSARSWEMLWLFVVSCTICILFSGPWPAVGAFGYYHVEPDNAYVHAFMALHNGTLKSIGDTEMQGIVQFPSLHVALGIFLIYVTRGIPILFLTSLELNTLLFFSTPAVGGHHFADLLGGIVLALVTIFVVKKAFTS